MRSVTEGWAEVGGRRFWILAGIVLAIAAEARFLGLTDRSLWFDEAHSVYVTQSSFLQLLGLVAHTDTHPPLYYVLLKGWMLFFGSGEIAVRSLSAVCGFLMVPLLYGFARRMIDRDVALAAAVLLAGSAFASRAAQEARMYPLLGLLALGSWASLRLALEQPRPRMWIAYAVTTALMLYTHYFGFLVFGSQVLFLIPRLWRDRRMVVAAWLAQAGALLLFLPWAPAFIMQAGSGRGWPTFRPPVGATAVTDLFGLFSFGGELFGAAGYFHVSSFSPWLVLLISAPFLALAGAGFYALRGERAWCLACYLVVPIAAAIVVSQRTNVFYPRYFSFLAPAWALLIGAGVDVTARSLLRLPSLRSLGRPAVAIGLVIAVLAANAPVINGYSYEGEDTYNWRAAAALVAGEAAPDDYLLFVPGFAEKAFEYYYKGPQERFQLWPIEIYKMVRIRKPPDSTVGTAWVRRLAEAHPRLWIVGTVPFPPAAYLRLRTMLAAGFDGERAWDFHYVYVFELKSHLYTAKAKRP
jgi:4-amino-4-deoxy-L-arabinose transferase-like glycosyltransferase